MTPEVRQQNLNKRKRNKEMLDKLKSQITHFDDTTKEVEGTSTACATKNGNVPKNNTKKETKKQNVRVLSNNNDNKQNKINGDNEIKATNNDKNQDSEKEYEIESISNHMRRRNTMLLLIKWRGFENPTWKPEDVMRTSVNDDVETYWEKLKNQNVRIILRKKGKKRELY